VILGVCFRWNGLDRFRSVFDGAVSGSDRSSVDRFSVERLPVQTGFRWNGLRFRPVSGGTVSGSDQFSG
jgi:hypothetical protein